MLLSIIGLIILLIIAYIIFVNFYPSFGGDISKERKEQYKISKQFKDGVFTNIKNVPKDPSFSEILTMSRKFFFEKVENSRPNQHIQSERIDSLRIVNYNKETRLIWFGHSTFLL